MKRNYILKAIILIFVASFSNAQSNSYPPAGDVTITSYSPQIFLQRNTDLGGFVAGIQTKMLDGKDNWYFGALHDQSWIVSKGNFENPRLTILNNGNAGFGTSTPSNLQGWGNVLDVAGVNHSKILATSVNSTHRVGIFSHNHEWYGGGGFVGTESDHPLHLISNYKVNMSILTNGNVGIGTLTPDTKLAVNGTIHSKEVKVDMTGWSDYVFKKEYNLATLQQVEKHIKEKGHLESIPSEGEVLKNGIHLGEMNAKLLQKIEELTLYLIEQNKKIEELTLLNLNQNEKIKNIEKKMKATTAQ